MAQGRTVSPAKLAAPGRPAPDQIETSSRKPALLYIKAQAEEAERQVTVVFRQAFTVDNSTSRDRPGTILITL